MSGEYSYIGRAWCGCVIAARVDRGDSRTASAVAQMICEGLTIERVRTEDVENLFNWDCKHRSRPPQSRSFESVFDVVEKGKQED